jgi:hypothetical protein
MAGMPHLARQWLFSAPARDAHVLLDAARLDDLASRLAADGSPRHDTLAGDTAGAPSMAPILATLAPEGPFTAWVLDSVWGRSASVFLRASAPLGALVRHARSVTLAYGPDLQPVVFRYHDPRVLRSFLPLCTPTQALRFFGPVRSFLVEDADPAIARHWTWRDARLTEDAFAPDDAEAPR